MRPFVLYFLLLSLGTVCLPRCAPEPTAEQLFTRHCGSCHLAPAPASLPRKVWEQSVLPEMAARMGIRTSGYAPGRHVSPEEFGRVRTGGFYPDAPTLPAQDWEAIRQYVLQGAPDTLAAPTPLAPDSLRGFTAYPLDVDGRDGSVVTYLGQGPDGLLVGDGYGKLTRVALTGGTPTEIYAARAPITHYTAGSSQPLLLEIGTIYPTEGHNGRLLRPTGEHLSIIADSLHRPVYFLSEDLSGDGAAEIVVCEYGNYTGALTLLRPDGKGGYDQERLSGKPGSIRVVARDVDGDGRRDLVSLHAQGDEGIDVFYQLPGGGFRRETVLQFPPVWGTSWFELVDFDGDGDLDLVTTHGDNADYSIVRKPYHGVRVYANDGCQGFTEIYFQPLPGATRVVARDFDADGDTDLAVACNFADFEHRPGATFVYLEYRGGASPHFTAHTTPLALDGRWLILEAGDYDGDGDTDLALGSFTLNFAPVPRGVERRWRESGTDVLFLANERIR